MNSVVPYVDVIEAQAYFDDCRLNAESWELSSVDNRLKALKEATNSINRLSYKGIKASNSQTNEFPRIISQFHGNVLLVVNNIVPDDIKKACCELALVLLDGVDPDLEEEDLGSSSQAYATVRIANDISVRKDHIRAGISSVRAWKYLLPYLNDPYSIHIKRA